MYRKPKSKNSLRVAMKTNDQVIHPKVLRELRADLNLLWSILSIDQWIDQIHSLYVELNAELANPNLGCDETNYRITARLVAIKEMTEMIPDDQTKKSVYDKNWPDTEKAYFRWRLGTN